MDQRNQMRIKTETLTLGFKGLTPPLLTRSTDAAFWDDVLLDSHHDSSSSALTAVVTTAFVRVEARAAVQEVDTLGPSLAEEPSRHDSSSSALTAVVTTARNSRVIVTRARGCERGTMSSCCSHLAGVCG
jgi:hypothetical protein